MLNNDYLDADNFEGSDKNYNYNQFLNVSLYIIDRYFALINDRIKLEKSLEEYIRNVFVAKYLSLNKELKEQYGIMNARFEIEPDIIDKNFENSRSIDIKVLNVTLNSWDEREYLAYECKRLKNTGKNDYYIDGGIARFMDKEKPYSEFMTVAGMIGFVEKSSISIDKIVDDINTRLSKHATIAPPKSTLLSPFIISPKLKTSYKSIHQRENNLPITLGHIMLNFSEVLI